MNFMGYRRPDGKAGIRNKVLILPTCVCSSETCRIVADQVEGAIYTSNQAGCSEVEQNLKICYDMYSALPLTLTYTVLYLSVLAVKAVHLTKWQMQ